MPGNQANESQLHSIEKIIAVLECAPLTAHSEPIFRVIADRWRDTRPYLPLVPSSEEAGTTHRIPSQYSIRLTAR